MKTMRIIISSLLILCSISISIGQNIESIIPTLEIETLLNSGPKDNRINFAFANIKNASSPNILYDSKNDLIVSVENILTYFDPSHTNAKSGFSQYRNFFNVQSIWFPTPLEFETIPEFYQLSQGVRDALFLPWTEEGRGWATMLYSGAEGNGAGVTREKRVGDIYMGALDWETVLHEFNHTMPGLFDEYTASGGWSDYVCVEGPNVTGQNYIEEVPWRKWLNEDTPVPTPYEDTYFDRVGLFEGNISGYFGCYRPTARSCYMGAGGFGEGFGQDMCNVCLQRFVTMLYKYVNVIENPQPASNQLEINGSDTILFSADIIKPEPNTQKYEWFLNGKLLVTGQESIEIDFDACDEYTVELVVTDTTEAVRFDEKFKELYPEPKQKHSWYIAQNAVSTYNLSAETIITPVDCTGTENGEIEIAVVGGVAPYVYTLNGEDQNTSHIKNLSSGIYSLIISDENGCSVIKEIEIPQVEIFDFEICSSFDQGNWELTTSVLTKGSEGLTYLWFDGSVEPTVTVYSTGTYSVQISNADTSCVVEREVVLTEVSTDLVVTHHIGHATENNNNGSIYLNLEEGLEPYEIMWYRSVKQDRTLPQDSQVIASDINPWTPKVYAFNNNSGNQLDFWAEEFTGNNYIGYDFGESTTIEYYSLTSNVDTKERDAKSWIFQGSNDGDDWTTIQQTSDIEFVERLQTKVFALDTPVSFKVFRLKFTENWGSDRIVVQEFEFGEYVKEEIKQYKNKKDIQGLFPGTYSYSVKDLNSNCKFSSVKIETISVIEFASISISKEGNYKVKIAEPLDNIEYYWTQNNDGSGLLHIGADFQPASPGQFYVRGFNKENSLFNRNVKGFSITMDEVPTIEILDEKIHVLNPDPNFNYYWYDKETDGTVLHYGIEFVPNKDGFYYVVSQKIQEIIEPINPSEIPGVNLWMDASDLDGNGIKDEGVLSSSAHSWEFKVGGQWAENSWFPYRANNQNGMGIVDFSTMWYQYISTSVSDSRTVLMAYEENTFSYNKTAPFHSLNEHIPRHIDATQLLSNDAPITTLNGKTFLNGEIVDPLIQENPLEFMILTVEFSELVNFSPNASDENWEGKLGELISWNVQLTEEQLKGVHEFMRRKWLSSAHLESPRLKVTWGTDHITDDDNDGVMNDVDECLNTPIGEVVDANGCSEIQLSIEDEQLKQGIKFYPNPVLNILTIDSEIPLKKVKIFSILGEKLIEVSANFEAISVESLPKGIYIVRVFSDETSTIIKLIKE